MTKPIRFEIFDLRVYIAIVERGSLSKAAEAIPLALSATSARLKALEERLGVQLVSRGAHGVAVTHAGQLFYDHARRLLKAATDAQDGMDILSGKGRLTLKIQSNATGLSSNLASQLGKFAKQYQEVDFQLQQSSSTEAIEAVGSGRADLGIVDGGYIKDDLLQLHYQNVKLAAIASQENSLVRADQCRFRDWLKQPLIGFQTNSSLQKFIERMALLEHQPAQFRVNAPSFGTAAQLVAQDIGVAILPKPAAERYAASLPIKVINLDETWANRELHLCLRPETETSLPVLKLAKFLADIGE